VNTEQGGPSYTRDEFLSDWELIRYETPERVVQRLGISPGAVAKRLTKAGLVEDARAFWRLTKKAAGP